MNDLRRLRGHLNGPTSVLQGRVILEMCKLGHEALIQLYNECACMRADSLIGAGSKA